MESDGGSDEDWEVKAIGVSNFSKGEIDTLLKECATVSDT